jgi:hypothetical protein
VSYEVSDTSIAPEIVRACGINRTFGLTMYPHPDELAGVFWSMDAQQQADFFQELWAAAGAPHKFDSQMLAVVQEALKRDAEGNAGAVSALRYLTVMFDYFDGQKNPVPAEDQSPRAAVTER